MNRPASVPGSPPLPVGLQLWSVRAALAVDVPGALARVRALGFTTVELAGTAGLPAQAFRQALAQAGVRATSMHVPYARLEEASEAVWDEAAVLGVRYVGIPNLPAEAGHLTPEAVRRGADTLNAWGEAAGAYGLRFFLHTHGPELRTVAGGARPLDALMARTEPGRVAFQMDVYWVMVAGLRPHDLLRAHAGRWRLLHLRDVAARVGATASHEEVALGQGIAGVPALISTARQIGVEACFLEDEADEPWGRMAQSVAFLRSLQAFQEASPPR